MFSQQGGSYTEQYPTAIGSAGQDLHRFNEGPTRYIHGPPKIGTKSTLERNVGTSPRGRFQQGVGSGPANCRPEPRVACKRSFVGPDPYNIATTSNRWTPRSNARFTPAHSGSHGLGSTSRQPWVLGRTAALAFDPYHIGHRQNAWHVTSTSIRSIMSNPMPQTPGGSTLLPHALRPPTSPSPIGYQRMKGFGDDHELLPMPKTRFGEGRSPFA